MQRQRQARPRAQATRREAQRPGGRIPEQALDGRPHVVRVEMRGQHLARVGDVLLVEDGPGTARDRHDLPLLGEHVAERAGGAVPLHVGHPVGGRQDGLPDGPLRRGLAAPEDAGEPEVLRPPRQVAPDRRGRAGSQPGVGGPEPEGELIVVAVGPAALQVVGDDQGDLALPRFIGEAGRGVLGGTRRDPVGVQGEQRIEQGRHVALAHGVHEQHRDQLTVRVGRAPDRPQVLPEPIHAEREVVDAPAGSAAAARSRASWPLVPASQTECRSCRVSYRSGCHQQRGGSCRPAPARPGNVPLLPC